MANRRGVAVLNRKTAGLGPQGHGVIVEPGEYPFTIMDGDDDIMTLGSPDDPAELIARMPLDYASEIRES